MPSNHDTFVVEVADESTEVFIFPRGVSEFAVKFAAEAIHLESDMISYYHGPTSSWKILEDQSPEVTRGGTISSIRKGPDKPPQ